ncbi:MAG TPA: PAS domain S-box protein, partial [Ktedonobacteraceae bacterium]|nr:PAS domain S-box protein [Ktedonobacteraceae bacterium]
MNPINHNSTLRVTTVAQTEAVGDQNEYGVRTLPAFSTTILKPIIEAYIALDHEWHIISFKQQTAQIKQNSREDLLGQKLWECFPEIVGTMFHQKCLEAAATGNTAEFEAKASHLPKWFRIHIFPTAEYITIFSRDITAQKQAEEQLRFQANILQHIHDSVIVTDLQGTITYWNDGADRIFGYTPEEMVGQNISLLFPGVDPPLLAHGLQKIADGQDYSDQWQKRRQDGSEIWIEV